MPALSALTSFYVNGGKDIVIRLAIKASKSCVE